MTLPNPFRTRHSEISSRDLDVFASTFGGEMLTVLPPHPFDQFFVLRSAPGAGKTSLMTAFSAPALSYIASQSNRHMSLHTQMTDMGALAIDGPTVLGILVNLNQGFLGLEDLPLDRGSRTRLFFRLLDARIMASIVRATLELEGSEGYRSASDFILKDLNGECSHILEKIGTSGIEILENAASAEGAILDLFDDLVGEEGGMPGGHPTLYSLTLLSKCSIWFAGQRLPLLPLVMLDDGHVLSSYQQQKLLAELSNRQLQVGRWLAVRSSALGSEELLEAGSPGRDYEVIEVEALTRERSAAGRALRNVAGQHLTHARYQRMLWDVADRRAQPTLSQVLSETRGLTALIDIDPDTTMDERGEEGLATILDRVKGQASRHGRYQVWYESLRHTAGRQALASAAEMEVLIERDQRRSQGDLFEELLPLTMDDAQQRGSSGLREAALLRACAEFKLPYYFGKDAYARMGSANIEQFLEICGNAMAQVLVQDDAGRDVSLSPTIQDRVARDASDAYYAELANLPHGNHVQRLVDAIAAISVLESRKPTIPYPPGVTGTALNMIERDRLLRLAEESAPAAALRDSLATAVAHNVVWLEQNYSVKNSRWMVIYLNRLLCPRYGMPLMLGGFRERRLSEMMTWFGDITAGQGVQERLL